MNKIQLLADSLSCTKTPTTDNGLTQFHVAALPSHSNLFMMAVLALTTAISFVAQMVCLNQHIQHLETNQAGKGGETIPRDKICVQASHINVQNEETKRWGRLYKSG